MKAKKKERNIRSTVEFVKDGGIFIIFEWRYKKNLMNQIPTNGLIGKIEEEILYSQLYPHLNPHILGE